MTLAEFLKKFKATCLACKWTALEYSGAMRAGDHYCLCPITAVVLEDFGQLYPLFDYINAGRRLGLSITDIKTIMNAADNRPGADKQVRKQLMEIIC